VKSENRSRGMLTQPAKTLSMLTSHLGKQDRFLASPPNNHIFSNFTMPIPFWTIGCLYGASSVAFGAFGAHGLKKTIADPARLANWNTAAHYQVNALFPHLRFPKYYTILLMPLYFSSSIPVFSFYLQQSLRKIHSQAACLLRE